LSDGVGVCKFAHFGKALMENDITAELTVVKLLEKWQ